MSTINLNTIGTFATGAYDEGAAEIVAHDPVSQRLFVVNGNDDTTEDGKLKFLTVPDRGPNGTPTDNIAPSNQPNAMH